MNITVIGTGHVGLIVGLSFAEIGHDVICIDNDEKKIAALESGNSPFFEPLVQELLERNLAEGRVQFTSNLAQGGSRDEVRGTATLTP